ncbi:MAG: hypothetical protein J7L95_08005 [Prolixibacteraceae bacterium]|nr:hypothetical protein [Prolixibacteraceae bacterium]
MFIKPATGLQKETIDSFIEKVDASYEKITGLNPEFYVAEISDGIKNYFNKF